jgi:hypothetical protein
LELSPPNDDKVHPYNHGDKLSPIVPLHHLHPHTQSPSPAVPPHHTHTHSLSHTVPPHHLHPHTLTHHRLLYCHTASFTHTHHHLLYCHSSSSTHTKTHSLSHTALALCIFHIPTHSLTHYHILTHCITLKQTQFYMGCGMWQISVVQPFKFPSSKPMYY